MKAIIGLGNPTDEYDKTRHNAGFLTIDLLAERMGAAYWKDECGALVAHIKNVAVCAVGINTTKHDKILLAKPQAFMNLSGGPTKKLCEKYDLTPDDIIVVHDDMDIEPGRIKVKRAGSSAGHNGIKSIDAKLGTNDYIRVRIGLGHAPGKMPTVDYVLQRPRGQALQDFEEGITLAADASEFLLTHTLEQTQQQFN